MQVFTMIDSAILFWHRPCAIRQYSCRNSPHLALFAVLAMRAGMNVIFTSSSTDLDEVCRRHPGVDEMFQFRLRARLTQTHHAVLPQCNITIDWLFPHYQRRTQSVAKDQNEQAARHGCTNFVGGGSSACLPSNFVHVKSWKIINWIRKIHIHVSLSVDRLERTFSEFWKGDYANVLSSGLCAICLGPIWH